MSVTESAAPEKLNLLGLAAPEMIAFMQSLGEKPFRARQLLKWIHSRGVDDFDAMTDIGKALRRRLHDCAQIKAPDVVSEHAAADGVRKWLISMPGGSLVETVLIPEDGRGTLCISSQVGCALDCSFCSTGKQGFQRDLTAAEIIGQLWLAKRALGAFDNPELRPVTNVVLMGMGEPLLNFDNVVAAASLMMDDHAHGLSKRRVTLSTSGVVPELERLAGVLDVSLAISLHAPDDDLRNQLVPINRKYPIAELLRATRKYMDSLPDRKRVVTIEYTLIKGVNDLDAQAHQVAKLLRDVPCKINLIPFNPFPGSGYRRPETRRVDRFRRLLQEAGYVVTVRSTRGDEIDAACGQLVGSVIDRTKRKARYDARLRQNASIITRTA